MSVFGMNTLKKITEIIETTEMILRKKITRCFTELSPKTLSTLSILSIFLEC